MLHYYVSKNFPAYNLQKTRLYVCGYVCDSSVDNDSTDVDCFLDFINVS